MNTRGTSVRKFIPAGTTELYGAAEVAARFCAISTRRRIHGVYWQHGWVPDAWQVSAEAVATEPIRFKAWPVLVAREAEAEFLRRTGFRSISAGLPFAYLPEAGGTNRKAGSLLVALRHSTHSVIRHQSASAKTVLEEIADRRQDYSTIRILLHERDMNDLELRSKLTSMKLIPCLGAHTHDRNSYFRLMNLFDSFEVMLTNSIGSHIPYALSRHVKVSLRWNPEEEFATTRVLSSNRKLSDWDSFFNRHRERLMEAVASDLSWLSADIGNPTSNPHWGQQQIGLPNRLSPSQLGELLNFTTKLGFHRNLLAGLRVVRAQWVRM